MARALSVENPCGTVGSGGVVAEPESTEIRKDDEAPANYEVLTPDLVGEVTHAIDAEDWNRVHALVDPLHAADMADLFGFISSDDRRRLIEALGNKVDPEMLSELEEGLRDEIIDLVDPKVIAAAVEALDTDDAVYLLEGLDEEDREAVLNAVPAPDRIAMRDALAYPEDSAGRLMQRDLVAVPPYWTVSHTIDYLRDAEDISSRFHVVFVVDPKFHPIGTVALDVLLRSRRPALLKDLMAPNPRLIPVDMDQEEVAFQFQQYRLVSAPVVDEEERLLGTVTVDDIVDVINEEAEEDIYRLAGVQDEDIYGSIPATVRTRFTWLVVNLFTAILAASVIKHFDATIQQMVALAVLMPIVAGMGGNAATQTLAVAVRALATRQLGVSNALRHVLKEAMVGSINGMLLAVLIGTAAAIWFSNPLLGMVLGLAMIINIISAALAGILVPLTLDRLGVDPAVASSIFVTMVTDVVGFFAFLGLAGLILVK
jgi:magnesium transporter